MELGDRRRCVVESSAWAAFTPVVFWLAGRWGTETTPRRLKVPAFVLIGIAAAVVLGLGGRELRTALVPPPPDAPFRHGGPPLWFAFLNALIIYLGVLAAGLARAYSLRYRARREQAAELQAQLAEARLEALRRQLDPHFLFNTLNAVSSLVERDPRGVRRMIARLSELLRHSLEAQRRAGDPADGRSSSCSGATSTSCRSASRDGSSVRAVRRRGRLENALVPTMVLQPLVENAIKHGVEKLDVGGRIVARGRARGRHARAPRARQRARRVPPPVRRRAGMGAASGSATRVARLEQLYGDRQRFTLRPRRGRRTAMRLP